jgi:NAD(P)-dependent dehydrogenase (short-subunit alcohol dehydrogenase family)
MKCNALITGCTGGIGRALVAAYHKNGYRVIGMDIAEGAANQTHELSAYIQCDLNKLCLESEYRDKIIDELKAFVDGSLTVLINNAAHQVVKPFDKLTSEDWAVSQNVNVMAPFILIKEMLSELERANGCVINMASIHAKLTKPEFAAYAASKAALIGLTAAVAVEMGGRIRINAISPAAIETPMLLAGFKGRNAEYQALKDMHPTRRIGTPEEIAEVAIFLSDQRVGFMTGANIEVNGAIGARLHDPV